MFLQRVLSSDSLLLEQDDDVLDRFKLLLVNIKTGKVEHDLYVQLESEDLQNPQTIFVGVQEIRE